MTHLVQLLLPLADNNGEGFSQAAFAAVRHELTQQFGDVTAFMRSPATGLWKKETGEVDRDEVVTVEVMVETLDREWWHAYRERLAQTFGQDALVVRAIEMETL
jgi:hypothetical protein